ncbi:MAG: sodium:calcium antiporter [Lentisphaerae bacterium]|nr:sodium:calcium antiporter [Lentisphaerota bacterium]
MRNAIAESLPLAWLVLGGSFALLAKSADSFVDSSVSLANRFRIPKLIIGLVLVSFATTTPEFAVSLLSTLRGQPSIALGNAVGSIICNTGLGLSLSAVFAAAAIPVIPHVIRTSGGFLSAMVLLAFAFLAPDHRLSRPEGALLVVLYGGYILFLFFQHQRRRYHDDIDPDAVAESLCVSVPRLGMLFALSLTGILVASEFVILSATTVARALRIPEGGIALTLIAFGSSVPEIATCLSAVRKGHGALAVGNILGANIINICWVAGVPALVRDLTASPEEFYFMFGALFVILGAALLMLRLHYRLTRRQGAVLLVLYALHLAGFFYWFTPR